MLIWENQSFCLKSLTKEMFLQSRIFFFFLKPTFWWNLTKSIWKAFWKEKFLTKKSNDFHLRIRLSWIPYRAIKTWMNLFWADHAGLIRKVRKSYSLYKKNQGDPKCNLNKRSSNWKKVVKILIWRLLSKMIISWDSMTSKSLFQYLMKPADISRTFYWEK